jgi:hypothetical protein
MQHPNRNRTNQGRRLSESELGIFSAILAGLR